MRTCNQVADHVIRHRFLFLRTRGNLGKELNITFRSGDGREVKRLHLPAERRTEFYQFPQYILMHLGIADNALFPLFT